MAPLIIEKVLALGLLLSLPSLRLLWTWISIIDIWCSRIWPMIVATHFKRRYLNILIITKYVLNSVNIYLIPNPIFLIFVRPRHTLFTSGQYFQLGTMAPHFNYRDLLTALVNVAITPPLISGLRKICSTYSSILFNWHSEYKPWYYCPGSLPSYLSQLTKPIFVHLSQNNRRKKSVPDWIWSGACAWESCFSAIFRSVNFELVPTGSNASFLPLVANCGVPLFIDCVILLTCDWNKNCSFWYRWLILREGLGAQLTTIWYLLSLLFSVAPLVWPAGVPVRAV